MTSPTIHLSPAAEAKLIDEQAVERGTRCLNLAEFAMRTVGNAERHAMRGIRAGIRSGRIPAKRIGKQYSIHWPTWVACEQRRAK
jgi:hypothetical protein